MLNKYASFPAALSLSTAVLLSACGGGGGGGTSTEIPVATVLTYSSVPVTIPPATYAMGSAERGAWNVLQEARILCGFGSPKQDARLDAAALAHARYLTEMSVTTTPEFLSHYETVTSNRYYTGYGPWDRTTYQRYGDQVAEILEATVWNDEVGNPPVFTPPDQRGAASMRNLLNTVYHLTGAMYDGADVGFGVDIQTAVSGTSRREEYRFGSLNGYQTQVIRLGAGNLATYPCANSINVPPVFVPAYESPNPFPAMTSTSQTLGPPIYLKVDSGQVLTLGTASVTSSSGVGIPITVLTAANDRQREIAANEVFVVPNNALLPNTNYQVSLSGIINSTRFTRNFTLRTGQ